MIALSRNLIFLLTFFYLTSCTEKGAHLIHDSSYLSLIEQQYQETLQLLQDQESGFMDINLKELTREEQEAFQFLMAGMPLTDLADYTASYFLKNIQIALEARSDFAYRAEIPEEIFLHYVLPPRINNENLDHFRNEYYPELAARVAGMELEQAAMEVNHWCQERVSYQAADIRTSGPMATLLNGRGRCGEQSTLLTAALRTIGIPARQVYVPRWAHTDDNHAWVEVFIDGKWSYTGGCEPAPDFNQGWFSGPAKRAMLVHTKAYGPYRGDEAIIRQTPYFAELNVLAHYAQTRNVSIQVADNFGGKVGGASVRIGLYNYAEFYPLATYQSQTERPVSFTTGNGDLWVEASKGDAWGIEKLSAEANELTIVLNRAIGDRFSLDEEFTPPLPIEVESTSDETCEFRLIQGDSLRNAYKSGFLSKNEATALALSWGADTSALLPILARSEGNHTAVTQFIRKGLAERYSINLITQLLLSISDKDLRDTPSEVLFDHLVYSELSSLDHSIDSFYRAYVLSPRIGREKLSPFRSFFLENIDARLMNEFEVNPETLLAWVKQEIMVEEERAYYDLPSTPIGVYTLKQCNRESRDIFLVALCRSLGIPSRLEEGTNRVQIHWKGQWMDANLSTGRLREIARSEVVILLNDSNAGASYFENFALARWTGSHFESLDFGYYYPLAKRNQFKLEPGYYRLLTSLRDSKGTIHTRQHYFMLGEGEQQTHVLAFPQEKPREALNATLNPAYEITRPGETTISLVDYVKSHPKSVVLRINPEQEPSRHVIKELNEALPALQQAQISLILIVPNAGYLEETAQYFDALAQYAHFYISPRFEEAMSSEFEETPYQGIRDLPNVMAIDSDGKPIYYSEGYEIGRGRNLWKVF